MPRTRSFLCWRNLLRSILLSLFIWIIISIFTKKKHFFYIFDCTIETVDTRILLFFLLLNHSLELLVVEFAVSIPVKLGHNGFNLKINFHFNFKFSFQFSVVKSNNFKSRPCLSEETWRGLRIRF